MSYRRGSGHSLESKQLIFCDFCSDEDLLLMVRARGCEGEGKGKLVTCDGLDGTRQPGRNTDKSEELKERLKLNSSGYEGGSRGLDHIMSHMTLNDLPFLRLPCLPVKVGNKARYGWYIVKCCIWVRQVRYSHFPLPPPLHLLIEIHYNPNPGSLEMVRYIGSMLNGSVCMNRSGTAQCRTLVFLLLESLV